MKQKKSWIKSLWSPLLVILAILLAINILGCSLVPVKTDPTPPQSKGPCPELNIELWNIDPVDMELFRKLKDNTEQYVKIQNNSSLRLFVAMDIREYGRLVEAYFKECRK